MLLFLSASRTTVPTTFSHRTGPARLLNRVVLPCSFPSLEVVRRGELSSLFYVYVSRTVADLNPRRQRLTLPLLFPHQRPTSPPLISPRDLSLSNIFKKARQLPGSHLTFPTGVHPESLLPRTSARGDASPLFMPHRQSPCLSAYK